MGDDDYAVLDEERRVGRFYREAVHGESKWMWFLQSTSALPPNNGIADTLDEAKAEFAAAYERYRQK